MGLCILATQVCRSSSPFPVDSNRGLLLCSPNRLASQPRPFGFESLPFHAHKKRLAFASLFGAANGTRTHTVSHTALNRARLPFRHCRIFDGRRLHRPLLLTYCLAASASTSVGVTSIRVTLTEKSFPITFLNFDHAYAFL